MSTALPVHYPTRSQTSTHAVADKPSNLRLSVASSAGGDDQPAEVELAEYKDGQPPPPVASYSALAQTTRQQSSQRTRGRSGSGGSADAGDEINVRTSTASIASTTTISRVSSLAPTPLASTQRDVRSSTSSLPPTRVGSPRTSIDEEGEPAAAEEKAMFSPGGGIAHHPESRSGAGLTPAHHRPPIPMGRPSHAPESALDKMKHFFTKMTACCGPPMTPSVIFDLKLTSLVDTYKRLPRFLDVSIDFLSQHLEQSQQFFTPITEAHLQEFVNYLEDAGEGEITYKAFEFYGVTCVGNFLKRFLDQLPEPLLTYTRYEQFCGAANFTPVGSYAVVHDLASPHSPTTQQRFLFPSMTAGDDHDQTLVMQSLVISLPNAHYLLLERLVCLWKKIVDYTHSRHIDTKPGQMNLQRLSLVFCASILAPLYAPTHAHAEHEASLRKAQEQQVLTYLITHYNVIFQRNPIRELLTVPKPERHIIDPNPALNESLTKWRTMAGNLKLNFSRRHFDERRMVKAFRAWKSMIKTNRRKAEAYRQLALLKQELLAEKHKNVQLSRELYGLKEEYELRDFQDQLRMQTGSIGAHGYGMTRVPLSMPSTTTTAPTKYVQEEKEPQSSSAGAGAHSSRRPIGATIGAGSNSAANYPRDLSNDLAAVRALQDQDRALTNTYSRY